MYNRGADTYFGRSGLQQPSGLGYDHRTREAINAVASGISSYRELASALAEAVDGTTIEIVETFEVPEPILIQNNMIRIICTGKGGLMPASAGLTLFDVKDADDCTFQNIKVFRNKAKQMFDYFMRFDWQENKKNVFIYDNYVETLSFLKCTFGWSNLTTPTVLNTAFLNDFIGQRTYISGNTHRNYQFAPRVNDYRFIEGFPHMFTITGNETEAAIELYGVGNIISNNGIFGITAGGVNTSVSIPATSQNIVTSNLVANAGAPIVFGGNIAADNLEIAL